jgi:hypothetical protein
MTDLEIAKKTIFQEHNKGRTCFDQGVLYRYLCMIARQLRINRIREVALNTR